MVGKKAAYIIGGVCFICIATFVLIHLGFVKDEPGNRYHAPKQFLTRQNLWIVNLCLGLVGGVLTGHKRVFPGAIAGVFSAAAITGTTLLYLSWRENILMVEIIFPMLTGLCGIFVYNFLTKNK